MLCYGTSIDASNLASKSIYFLHQGLERLVKIPKQRVNSKFKDATAQMLKKDEVQ